MTNKELTEILIKALLYKWKQTKSTTIAYDICNTLCEYYKIDTNSDLTFPPINDNKRNDPLIKDDKMRKAVRAWAEALGVDEVSYNSCAEYSEGRFEAEMGMADIDFGRVIGLKDGNYTIAELCGEEEE